MHARIIPTRTLLRRSLQYQPMKWDSSTTPQHIVSKFDNFVLKITGLTKGPVSEISIDKMEKATSRFRIGMMFSMMGFCVIGSVYAVFLGKRDRAAHVNSVAQQNRDRHKKVKEN